MAYRADRFTGIRDLIYPSEIAAQRPMMEPKPHCPLPGVEDGPDHPEHENEGSASLSLRGDREESMCERFNRELRSGIGVGRPEEDND